MATPTLTYRMICVSGVLVAMTIAGVCVSHKTAGNRMEAGGRIGQGAANLEGRAAVDYLKEHGIYDRVRSSIEAAEYRLSPEQPGRQRRSKVYLADNPAQNLSARFSARKMVLHPLRGKTDRGEHVALELCGYGYGKRMVAAGAGSMRVEGNRVEIDRTVVKKGSTHHGEVTEWYSNSKEGLEEGITFNEPPGNRSGYSALRVKMEVSGNVKVAAVDSGKAVELRRSNGEAWLRYDQLAATDARGRALPARFEATGREIALVISDKEAVYPVKVDPLFTQISELTAGDAGVGNNFGWSVAISGDTVVVGADNKNSTTGAAYVFERNVGGLENWGQVKEITAHDKAALDRFGYSVAISVDTVVVGAPYKNTETGAAYVFERNEGGTENWGQVKKLTAGDAALGDSFGYSVAISVDTLVVGAPDKNTNTGAAYVFERNDGGSENWGQVKELTAGDAALGDFFADSVAISADTVVVGAYGKNSHTGAAYVFERNSENWDQVKELTAGDATTGDFFGLYVAISVDTVVVGAPFKNSITGAAYVFERNQGGSEYWGQVKKLIAGDAVASDVFSDSVAISGDTVVVGAYGKNSYTGAAYVFERNQGGLENWGQCQEITAGDAATGDYFGSSVAISVDTVVVGAYPKNSFTGAAYVFEPVRPPAISKMFGSSTVPVGGTASLTFTLTNPNPTVALTGVGFTDPFPSGMVVASPANTSDSCGGTFAPNPGDTSLTFSGGTIPAGGSCTISVTVQMTTAGTKVNQTSAVTSDNGGTGLPSNTATAVAAYDKCLKDNTRGIYVQFSSQTGNYTFTICGPYGFTMSGKGTVQVVNSILNITDSKPDRRVTIQYSLSSLTGTATLIRILSSGVSQRYTIYDTNPRAVCQCGS